MAIQRTSFGKVEQDGTGLNSLQNVRTFLEEKVDLPRNVSEETKAKVRSYRAVSWKVDWRRKTKLFVKSRGRILRDCATVDYVDVLSFMDELEQTRLSCRRDIRELAPELTALYKDYEKSPLTPVKKRAREICGYIDKRVLSDELDLHAYLNSKFSGSIYSLAYVKSRGHWLWTDRSIIPSKNIVIAEDDNGTQNLLIEITEEDQYFQEMKEKLTDVTQVTKEGEKKEEKKEENEGLKEGKKEECKPFSEAESNNITRLILSKAAHDVDVNVRILDRTVRQRSIGELGSYHTYRWDDSFHRKIDNDLSSKLGNLLKGRSWYLRKVKAPLLNLCFHDRERKAVTGKWYRLKHRYIGVSAKLKERRNKLRSYGVSLKTREEEPCMECCKAFALLGLSLTATDREIKEAYKRAITGVHPDKRKCKSEEERKRLTEVMASYKEARIQLNSHKAQECSTCAALRKPGCKECREEFNHDCMKFQEELKNWQQKRDEVHENEQRERDEVHVEEMQRVVVEQRERDEAHENEQRERDEVHVEEMQRVVVEQRERDEAHVEEMQRVVVEQKERDEAHQAEIEALERRTEETVRRILAERAQPEGERGEGERGEGERGEEEREEEQTEGPSSSSGFFRS